MNSSAEEFESIHELLKWRAYTTPNTVAYTAGGNGQLAGLNITWRDHFRQILTIQGDLNSIGISPGDQVGVLLSTGYMWELIEKGLYIQGARVAALDKFICNSLTTAELAEYDVFITDDLHRTWLDSRFAETEPIRVGDYDLHAYILTSNSCCHCQPDLRSDPDLKLHSGGSLNSNLANGCASVISFSSGSTGRPETVSFTQQQLIQACKQIAAIYPEMTPGSKTLAWMPVTGLYQRVFNTLAILTGTTTSFAEDYSSIWQQLTDSPPTYLIGVPLFYEELKQRLSDHKHGQSLRTALSSSLQFMLTGSAKSRIDTLRFFADFGAPLLEGYGMSECIIPISLNSLTDYKIGTVGRILPVNQVRITSEGCLTLSSPGLCHEISSTHSSSVPSFTSGDIVSLSADGRLTVLGRSGEILKTTSGRRVISSKIESCVSTSLDVEQCVIVNTPDEKLLGMVFLCKPLQDPSVELAHRLHHYLQSANQQLPRSAEISRWFVVPRKASLERGELTRTGKVKRALLQDKLVKYNATPQTEKDMDQEFTIKELEIVWAKSF